MSNIKVVGTDRDIFDTSLRAEVYIQNGSDELYKLEVSRLDIAEVYHFVMGKGKDALRGIKFQLPLQCDPQYTIDMIADKIEIGETKIPTRHVGNGNSYIVIEFMYHSYGLDQCVIRKNKSGQPVLEFRNVVEIATASSSMSATSGSVVRMKKLKQPPPF